MGRIFPITRIENISNRISKQFSFLIFQVLKDAIFFITYIELIIIQII